MELAVAENGQMLLLDSTAVEKLVVANVQTPRGERRMHQGFPAEVHPVQYIRRLPSTPDRDDSFLGQRFRATPSPEKSRFSAIHRSLLARLCGRFREFPEFDAGEVGSATLAGQVK